MRDRRWLGGCLAPGRWRGWALAAAFGVALSGQAGAVIVSGDTGQPATPNTTAPAGFEDAWNRVGSLGGGSGVYLGNGYVLSARHVNGGGTFSIDGTSHTLISGTTVTLSNPTGLGLTAEADLWLNRYAVPDDSPLFGLGVIDIRDTAVTSGLGPAIIIGEGLGQTTTTPINVGAGQTGFAWGAGETRRWGETFTSSAVTFGVNSSTGVRDILGYQSSLFNQNDNRAIAAAGDSGGGLFLMDGGEVVLAGIIHAVTTFENQNDDTAAYGNRTLFSDLSAYLDQIRVVEGDLTGDGYVGVEDLDLILAHWGGAVTAGDWTQGDADGDGFVGESDLNHVLAHFGAGTPPPASIPEPGTAGLVLGLVGLLARRRRIRKADTAQE